MGPSGIANKFFQELARRNGTTPATFTNVLDIRHFAANLFGKFTVVRLAPKIFAAAAASFARISGVP
jgi:hypothetical protein